MLATCSNRLLKRRRFARSMIPVFRYTAHAEAVNLVTWSFLWIECSVHLETIRC
ncbi:hypothetical protein RMSM_03417 [Rhodopirellula maiorica SM1]|uniref:Uncharacterized protein n=1 Tax=Rhodopirellula maiorica SM1 TaxID=1265738 RepID=M5RK28_9BACT|nr:hypothetical protein RMSM_03417 [Rhodopirellula maiorica SM1]